MLVNLKEIITMAEKGNFAIPAFNVYNTESIMGVIKAAEEERAPIIIQVYPRLFNEEVGYYICPAIVAAARKATVPVCFHLDHGPSEMEVQKALRWGATGIGSVNDDAMDDFTDPQEAAEFVKRTGVCCLAVLIGNAHGHYKKTPKLDIDRVKAIREATGGIPLVLHGGSGIPDDQVKAAINAGVRKMNIGTDVCCAFADGTKEILDDPNRSLAIDLFMKHPIESVKKLAVEKIRLVGANGKA